MCLTCLTQVNVYVVRFVILYVMARDEDEGENGRVSYRIQAGNSAARFSLNPDTGEMPHLKMSCRHAIRTRFTITQMVGFSVGVKD